MKKADSLIICTTPLQMVIAEKIIQKLPHQKFDLLVLAQADNEKYKYYFRRLKSKCLNALFFVLRKGIVGFVKFLKTIQEKKLNSRYLNIYLASIDSSYCQYMLSKSKKPRIFTFDDGAANIVLNSIFYKAINYSQPKIFMRKVLGINFTREDIKRESLLHYTLYKDTPNIIDNTKVLSLINVSDNNYQLYQETSQPCNIYLGQPLDELSDYFTSERLNSILMNLNITHYFPHPRESAIPNGNYKVIDSSLIFEDYIINMARNSSQKINIFSFISTALLNIATIEQIQVNYILHPRLESKYKDFYNLAHNHFNIPLVNIYEYE